MMCWLLAGKTQNAPKLQNFKHESCRYFKCFKMRAGSILATKLNTIGLPKREKYNKYLTVHPNSVDWFLTVISLTFKEILSVYEVLSQINLCWIFPLLKKRKKMFCQTIKTKISAFLRKIKGWSLLWLASIVNLFHKYFLKLNIIHLLLDFFSCGFLCLFVLKSLMQGLNLVRDTGCL